MLIDIHDLGSLHRRTIWFISIYDSIPTQIEQLRVRHPFPNGFTPLTISAPFILPISAPCIVFVLLVTFGVEISIIMSFRWRLWFCQEVVKERPGFHVVVRWDFYLMSDTVHSLFANRTSKRQRSWGMWLAWEPFQGAPSPTGKADVEAVDGMVRVVLTGRRGGNA